MIRYAMTCQDCGARFDAWFRNAQSCVDQLAGRLVQCPACGGAQVEKALMAPSVAPKTRRPAPAADANEAAAREAEKEAAQEAEKETAPAPPPADPSATGGTAPLATARRELEQKLRALRAHIEATAEPVGRRFPDEARAIHEGDAEARPIYGEASPEEAEALRDEGVPIAPIPWIDKTDD